MQMSDSLVALFNRQITIELGASISYLQMGAYLESQSLVGMASWMRIQAEEEKEHAERFMAFVLDRDNEVAVGAIDAPRHEFAGPADVFEVALEQERGVTAAIAEIYAQAQQDSDVTSFPLLQEFLSEQVEEESAVQEVIDRLALAGNDGAALLEVDRELGARQPE